MAHHDDSSGHHGHQHSHTAEAQDGLAAILELDAAVFAGYLAAVTDRLADLAATGPGPGLRRIADLGAGTGTGTLVLLERFPDAHVTAVDTSPEMLDRITESAREHGVGGRVRTLEADAGAGLPGLRDLDLVWASSSMHHLDDPVVALAGIRTSLRPGGLLAVLEMDGFPRFLPDHGPQERPGLEARSHLALEAERRERMPHLSEDWGALIAAAGFTIEEQQTDHLDLAGPPHADLGRYAHLVLNRVRGAVQGRLDAEDLSAFDALLDGGALDIRHRPDLSVRSTRHLWVARRA